MQLFVTDADAAAAARTLTNVQVNAAIREVTQMLYGVVALRGVPIEATLATGEPIYTTKANVMLHPQTAWLAASRAHVAWALAHVHQLLRCWARFKRASDDEALETHGCGKHVRHLEAALGTSAARAKLPSKVSASAWLATLTSEQRDRWSPRVARRNLPHGCLFGLLNMEETFWIEDDLVGSYRQLQAYNLTRASILKLNPELASGAGYGPPAPNPAQRKRIAEELKARKRARV